MAFPGVAVRNPLWGARRRWVLQEPLQPASGRSCCFQAPSVAVTRQPFTFAAPPECRCVGGSGLRWALELS